MTLNLGSQPKEYQIYKKEWVSDAVPAREPILLLHDSLGCTDTWRDFPGRLCHVTGRRVISYDRAGFGRSSARTDKLSHNFIDQETDVIAQLAETLQLDEFILFGHSVGGGMALTAASHLTDCRAVISESAQSLMEPETKSGIIAGSTRFQPPEQMQRLRRYHGDKAEWVLRSWADGWIRPEFENWSLRPVLQMLHAPVLVIHGEQDEFATRAQPDLIASASRGFVQSEILSNCGHVPHREQTEVVLAKISGFLNSAL